MTFVTFCSCTLTSIRVRGRLQFSLRFHHVICGQQTLCRTPVYYIHVTHCSLLWSYKIVKIAQCVTAPLNSWKNLINEINHMMESIIIDNIVELWWFCAQNPNLMPFCFSRFLESCFFGAFFCPVTVLIVSIAIYRILFRAGR